MAKRRHQLKWRSNCKKIFYFSCFVDSLICEQTKVSKIQKLMNTENYKHEIKLGKLSKRLGLRERAGGWRGRRGAGKGAGRGGVGVGEEGDGERGRGDGE